MAAAEAGHASWLARAMSSNAEASHSETMLASAFDGSLMRDRTDRFPSLQCHRQGQKGSSPWAPDTGSVAMNSFARSRLGMDSLAAWTRSEPGWLRPAAAKPSSGAHWMEACGVPSSSAPPAVAQPKAARRATGGQPAEPSTGPPETIHRGKNDPTKSPPDQAGLQTQD